jgi:hypothetical protein
MFFSMVTGLFLASFVWSDGECCTAIHLCPELINQFCIFPVSLLASSVVLREGYPHPITGGTVGEITKNGVFTTVFSNMLSLSLPALISVLRDRAHVKANMLRRTLFKADIGLVLTEEVVGDSELIRTGTNTSLY